MPIGSAFVKFKTFVAAAIAVLVMASCTKNPLGSNAADIADQFQPGLDVSFEYSVVSVGSASINTGQNSRVDLVAYDKNNIRYVVNDLAVELAIVESSGTSRGTFSAVQWDDTTQSYYSMFRGTKSGSAVEVTAKVNGKIVTRTPRPTLKVKGISNPQLANFQTTPSSLIVSSGSDLTLNLRLLDDSLNPMDAGNVDIKYYFVGGTSTFSPTLLTATDNSDGTYTAHFTGLKSGTAAQLYLRYEGNTDIATGMFFTVIPGPAAKLVFAQSPTNSNAGQPLISAAHVEVRDANDNTVTTSAANITVSLSTNPTAATLLGTLVRAATSGAANFSDLQINKASVGYVLSASSPGLLTGTSSAFAVGPGPAVSLALLNQPSSLTAGSGIASLQVQIRDAYGNTVTGSSASVSVALASGPAGGSLQGTVSVSAVSGVATFSNLNATFAGTGYALRFTSSGLSGVDSTTFDVNFGPANKLSMLVQPSGGTAGQAWAAQPQVEILDSYNNRVTTSAANVTIAIANNAGSPVLGSLGGTLTSTASSGVASFSGLSIDKVGSGYTLTASSAGVSSVLSSGFNIGFASPSRLAFKTQPVGGIAGQLWGTQPVVEVQDAFANRITNSTASIAVAFGVNPPSGTVLGATTINAVAGLASFTDLRTNSAAAGYTIVVSAGGLTSATSDAFSVAAAAAVKLAISTQPTSTTAASPISAIGIQVQDTFGNLVSTVSPNISVALQANPGAATLSGTTSVSATAGSATFSDLSLNRSASGYVLRFESSGLTSVDSASFPIVPGTPNKLVFTTQPSSASSEQVLSAQPVVEVQDSWGNTVLSDNRQITLALGSNPGGSVLSGTLVRNAVSGTMTSTDLSLDKAGNGYSIVATAVGITSATSSNFNIVAGAATRLSIVTQPSSSTAGVAFPQQPQVEVLDQAGNRVLTSTASIAFAIGNNPPSATLSGSTTVVASSGLASFSGLSIAKNATGYTLVASSGGLTAATTSAFDISVAPAYAIRIIQQPAASTTAGVSIGPIQAEVVDNQGNRITSSSATVSLAFANNPGSATLSGTVSRVATAGLVTFTGLTLDKSGTGYVLQANSAGLGSDTTSAFNIVASSPHHLVYSSQPGNGTAGLSFGVQPVVRIEDIFGNLATTSTATVALSISTNPSAGVFSGTTSVAASAGIATFSGLSIDKAGVGYVVTAASGGLTSAATSAFNLLPGAANRLAITNQPGGGAAGSWWSSQPIVEIQDVNGNRVTTSSAVVTVAIANNPGSGTLSGTTTATAVNGIATFTDLSIDAASAGYTLNFSSSGLAAATSAGFNITPASASRLVFAQQPSSSVAGVAFAQQPRIEVQDTLGNVVTTFNDNVTLSIGSNPGSSTLSGTVTVAAVSGVATFSGLSMNKSGTAYTLNASSASTSTFASTGFNITHAAANQLSMVAQPSSSVAGTAFGVQPQVEVQDAFGNRVLSSTASINLAIANNPGSSTLSGTATVAASSGLATFAGLSMNKTGTGYTLAASSGGLTSVSTAAFNISPGAAAALAVAVQPVNSVAGQTMTAVQVQVLDGSGNIVPASSALVSVTLLANPGGSLLSGTASVNAVSGIATFSDLSLNKTGAGYQLRFTSGTLGSVDSATFNVTPGAPFRLSFTSQPIGGTTDAVLSTQPVVEIQDDQGNRVVSATDTVTMTISANPGASSLLGTASLNGVAGVATFTNLRLNKSASGYALTASAAGLANAVSDSFTVTPGAAAKLAMVQSPAQTVAGVAFGSQPVIQIQDAQSNLVSSSSASVTVAIQTNPGSSTLSGTATVSASGGIATFSGLSLNKSGVGYVLNATSGALTSAATTAFDIVAGSATQLAYVSQPVNVTAGATMTGFGVEAQDTLGNRVLSSSLSVTLAFATNPGSGTLSGTVTRTMTSGLATFNDLSIAKAATGYSLLATSGGVTSATSSLFNVNPGTASLLAFTTQPSGGTAGSVWAQQPVVQVQDIYGNVVPSSSAPVTLAILNNTGGGTLSGTASVAASSGVVTFTGLSINKSAGGYTLQATSPGLTSADSSAFAITPGVATKLAFSTSPSNSSAGGVFAAQPTVLIQDFYGNTVTGSSATVHLAIAANPGSGTLAGTVDASAISGIATFTGLSINKAGLGYTLLASSGALTTDTSSTFNISANAPTQIGVVTQPTNTTAGVSLSTAPAFEILDAYGNRVTTSTASVTVSIATNPGSGILSGTTIRSAVAGLATFTGLSINKSGAGYTLSADSGVLAGGTTSGFTINSGAAAKLAVSTQPVNTIAGTSIPNVEVQILDSFDNLTTSTASVVVALAANPGSDTLGGTLTQSAIAGTATFSGLNLTVAKSGYALGFSSTGLTPTSSSAFAITPATANKLAFTTAPGAGVAGTALTQQPVVEVQDTYGNRVTASSATVTVAIGTNPAGGSLSGTAALNAVSGVVTFAGLSIEKAAAGYTLVASSAALTSATSAAFAISATAPAKLLVTTQPNNSIAGVAVPSQPVINVADVYDNVVTTSSASVSIAILVNPGGATLSGTSTRVAVNGVVPFVGLSLNKSGTGYSLQATSSGLTAVTTSTFDVSPASAAKLAITQNPGDSTAGLALTPQPIVEIRDAFDNVVTASSGTVNLAIANNGGSPIAGVLGGTTSIAASSGVASFSGLSIDRVGVGYTLTATSGGLTSATTTAFNVSLGAATQLVLVQQPANSVAGSTLAAAPRIEVRDGSGNVDTSSSASITVALTTNPGSSTLSGTLTVAAVNGVATFNGLSLNKVGTGYRLTFTSGALTQAQSSAFDIAPGAANKLSFSSSPVNTVAGSTFATQPTVQILDAQDNLLASSSLNVTLAIGANPGAGVLAGTLTVAAVNGVATFSGLSINKTGTAYTLTAASGALTAGTSSTFNITPGTPTSLAFAAQPGATVAGASFASQPVVNVLDANLNIVTTSSAAVTVAIANNAGSGALAGTLTVAAVNGVASFSGLSINKTGSGYTLSAGSGVLTAATSGAFNITPGVATKLAFSTQPANSIAGSSLAVSPVVQVRDVNDNVVTTDASSVTIAISNNAGPGGVLSGTTTVSAVGGVATFTGLSIDKVGTGYTLIVSDGALTTAISAAFNIAPGASNKLSFNVSPGNWVSASTAGTQPVVRILDAQNNVVTSDNSNITLSIANNAGPGGALSGTVTIAAVSGVATFSGLSIDKTGTGYTLGAASGALIAATSTAFNVTPGAANKLAFGTQPGNWVSGSTAGTQPVVRVLDAQNNIVTTDTSSVTLAIANNAGPGGVLSGTLTVAAVAGVATFSGLSIDKTGTGYTLLATDGALANITSNAFNISPGAANKLTFATQPGNWISGSTAGTQPVINVLDAQNNIVTGSSASVTLAIANNAGPGGVLSGTLTVSAVSGVATFTGLSLDKVGTGYTLLASSGVLATSTSNGFNITPGVANKLAFGTQPGNWISASTAGTQPVVQILDAQNNIVTTDTSNVTIAIANNAGPGGVLSGTLTVAAVSGVATFSGLSIDKAGTGYTLIATDGVLTNITSNGFNITPGAANRLAFGTQPGNWISASTAGTQPVVRVLDAQNNIVTTDTSNVTLAIANNAGPGGVLSGTLTVAAVAGVATFSGLSIDKTGSGYTLIATDGVLTNITSNAFNITPGAANKLAFGTQPGNWISASTAGTQPVVQILDAQNNIVTTDTSSVTLAISNNAGPGGVLSGTVTVAAVAGVATFSGLSIDKTGTGYTLLATDGVLTNITSNAFNITPGAANKLAFGTQPGNWVSASTAGTQPVVRILDAQNNIVTTDTSSVTLAIANNAGPGGTLSGTVTVAAVAGVATFTGLSIDKTGTGYTLIATDGVLTNITSNAFNISPGAANKLVFATQPGNWISGSTAGTQPIINVLDAQNNIVTGSSASVTLAISNDAGPGGVLSGTLTVSAVSGVATFSGLSLDKVGTGYTLLASSGVLATSTSNGFNITPGVANKLAFGTQPGNWISASTAGTQPVVRVLDAQNNIVTTDTSNVTLAISNNAGPGGVLSGTLTVAAVAGVATFSGLSIDKTGTGYTLIATDGALTNITSNAFNITPGAANKLAFGTQPGNWISGSTAGTQPVVRVLDAQNNIVTTDTSNVTIAISNNAGPGGVLSGTLTVAAVAGVATFSGLSIDKTGTGYTLIATDGVLTNITSNAFNISPGAANKLAFATQPGNWISGSTAGTQPVINVLDAQNNIVTTDTSNVTLAIANNAGPGGTLSGTVTVAAVAGVATFSGLSIDKTGTGYTLIATDGALTNITSNAFNITPGAANKLAFGTQPGNWVSASTAGTQPVVHVLDAQNNIVTTDTSNVTLAIANNAGPGGILSGTLTVAAVAGVATFSGLSIDKTGTGYTLIATDGVLTNITSNAFNITPGAANRLAFGTQPGNWISASTAGTQPVVRVLDAQNNIVTTDTSNVTLAIANNAGPGGVLSGTVTVAAVAGVATFSGLSIDKTGTGYTLLATDGVLTNITSNAFNITPGAANKLVFATQPGNWVSGSTAGTQPVINVLDAQNNIVTGSSASVTLAISNNAGPGGVLSGTLTVAAVSGVATFTGLSLDKVGTGYTLLASSGVLATSTSNAFNITPGGATKLSFATQPGNWISASTAGTQPVINVLDAQNNIVTTDTSNVTLAISNNAGPGGVLSGTVTVAAVAGVATFSGLSIDKTGTGYTLIATDGVLTNITSNAFNITPGAANKLAFGTQPGNWISASTAGTQPVVRILDAQNNVVTTDTSNVTLAIANNAGPGGTLSGTLTVAAVAGVATFSGLSIDKTGTGYTLIATDGALTNITSSAFNITPGAASKLAFGTQPGNWVSGSTAGTQPVVRVLDAQNNIVTTDTSNVTIAIANNAGPGGTLSGTLTVAAVAGVATFSGLSIDKTGTGYTLLATDGALTNITSNAFNITPGAANKLTFGTQPGNWISASTAGTQPVINVLDAQNNIVTGSSASVTLAISNDAGPGGVLSGTLTVSAVSGVATFTGLSIDKVGTGYTLLASSGVLATSTSNAFNITPGAANKLAFGTQPGNWISASTAGTQPVVRILDAQNNIVTTDTSSVTLAISNNAGPGGTLSGTVTVAAVAGVATFSGLSIDKTGTGYTLIATDGALTNITSNAFNITPGAANKLAFGTQPGNWISASTAGTQPVVRVLDAQNNIVTTDTSSVTLAIANNAGPGGVLSGTLTVAAVAGVATFSGLSIDKTGTGYTLIATDGALTNITSSAFNITSGAANKLAFGTQPGNWVSASTAGTQPVVRVLDAQDNIVTTDTSSVTLAILNNAGPGGTLSGTLTVAAVAGVATFSGLSIDKTGTGYTLLATDGALTNIASSAFNITPGAASKLAFGTQPGNWVSGSTAGTQPVVRVLDAQNNIVTTDTSNVTLAIANNAGPGGVLSGTLTVAAVAGVATFSGLSIDKTGTGYTLIATDGVLTNITSNAFNITPGAANKLAFGTQPGHWISGSTAGTQPVINVLDAQNNIVTGSSASVTLAIANNAGPGGVLSGTLTVAAVSGVATFSGLSLDKVGTGYTLLASSGALTTSTSNGFNITPGAANRLAFGTQPGNWISASTAGTQPVVRVLDAENNLVTTDTSNVTLAISNNAGPGGVLSGTLTVAAVAGVATFTGLSIDKTGTGYTLIATDGALTNITSNAFNITPGAANKLAFGTQPGNWISASTAGTQPVVRVLDAQNNIVTTDTSSVTLAIANNAGPGGVLSGTLTVAAVAGVATFSGLSIDKTGTGYTLLATDGALTNITSSGFNITPGAASKLSFSTAPGTSSAGSLLSPQPVVRVLDAQNNIVTGSSAAVTLAIGTNAGPGGVLSGTTPLNAVSGAATFSDISIDKPGAGYTLTATSGVLTSATTAGFTVSSNPPAVPTGLAATVTDASVALTWTVSAGATSYNIMRGTVSGSLTQIATSGTNSYTDTTPSNGTTYFYAVQAVRTAGTSASSTEVSGRPLGTVTISSTTVSASQALTLAWSASTGAATYTVKYSTTSGSAASGTTGCTTTAPTATCAVTGLTAGTTYYFVVIASNAIGATASTTSVQSSGVPMAAFTISSVVGGNAQAVVTWAASSGATAYTVRYGTSTGVYGTTFTTSGTSPTTVTGLSNGTTYYFMVTATNASGSLNATAEMSQITAPGAFTISTATKGNGQVALTWAAATGAATYTVRYGTSTGVYGTTFASGLTGTSSTVTGLTNGTTYYFMVTAVNTGGTRNATAEFSAIPGQPVLVTILDQTTIGMTAGWNGVLNFTLANVASGLACTDVTSTSSNTALVLNSGVVFSGTYPNCTATISVSGNTNGATNLTFTVTYGSATATQTFAYQVLPAAAAAYSLRKIVGGYAGNAIQVRRSSDNATSNIGFTSAGDLNTTTLTTFCGANSCYITTWYDQSGGARNMTQATNASQPRIVNAGTVDVVGIRPNVYFNATRLATANVNLFGSGVTMVGVAKGMATAPSAFITKTGTSAGASQNYPAPFDFTTSANVFNIGSAASTSKTAITMSGTTPRADVTSNVAQSVYSFASGTSGTFYAYLNGVQAGSGAVPTYSDDGAAIMMGNRADGASSANYYTPEVVLFGSVLSLANRNLLEQSQTTYFISSAVSQLSVSPSVAYSLRQLYTTYSGNLITVRRSSDNTTANIGFVTGGDLDTVALANFCGINTCYVTTWYDQSGNAKNLTQATNVSQPTIMSGGTLNMMNGRPTIVSSNNTFMTLASPVSTTLYSANIVAQKQNSTNDVIFLGSNLANKQLLRVDANQRPRCYWGTDQWSSTTWDVTTARSVITLTRDGSNVMAPFLNGVAAATFGQNAGVVEFSQLIGINNAGYGSGNNNISEVFFFSSTLSTTDRQALENNQLTYW